MISYKHKKCRKNEFMIDRKISEKHWVVVNMNSTKNNNESLFQGNILKSVYL